MYKVKNNLVPSYISDFYHCNTSKYNLRNADDFSLPRKILLSMAQDLLFGLNCTSPSNRLNQWALLKDERKLRKGRKKAWPDRYQEPITRSEQLPCARVTAFSRTSLFLERFWLEFWISFIFQTSQQNLQTYRPCLLITFSFPFWYLILRMRS